MMKDVLVTEKEYDKAADVFVSRDDVRFHSVSPDEETLASAVRRYRAGAVVVGVETYRGPLYEALREVGTENGWPGSLIARFGVGHDGINKELCGKSDIFIANTPGALDRSVAEHAFWLLGALLRKIVSSDRAVRAGEFPSLSGVEVFDKTMLVVGLGAIGRIVAGIARFGFGMRVVATDRLSVAELAERTGLSPDSFLEKFGVQKMSARLDELLGEADVVSVHLFSDETTKHFFSRSQFDGMKESAVLVNTSRGTVIDEVALFEALKTGRIAGAALDVFETEPYRPACSGADLRFLSNIIMTSHLGSSSIEANRRMAVSVMKNIHLFFRHRVSEMDLVDRRILDR